MTEKKMGICKGPFTLREFTRSMHTLVSVLLPQSRLDQFMVGHWFQNYDTICVRFFATYTCDFSCFVGFFSQVCDHFFLKHAYICAQQKSYMCVTNKHVCIGSQKVASYKTPRIIRSAKNRFMYDDAEK